MKKTFKCLIKNKLFFVYIIFSVLIFVTKLLSINEVLEYNISDIREAFLYIVSGFSFYFINRYLELNSIKKEYNFWISMDYPTLSLNTYYGLNNSNEGLKDFNNLRLLLAKNIKNDDITVVNINKINTHFISIKYQVLDGLTHEQKMAYYKTNDETKKQIEKNILSKTINYRWIIENI